MEFLAVVAVVTGSFCFIVICGLISNFLSFKRNGHLCKNHKKHAIILPDGQRPQSRFNYGYECEVCGKRWWTGTASEPVPTQELLDWINYKKQDDSRDVK